MPVVSWALTASTVWNLQLSCFEGSHMQPQVSHTAGRVRGCDPSSHLPVLWPVAFAHLRFGQMISQLVTGKRCGPRLVKQWFLCANTPPPLALQGSRRGRTLQKRKWRVAEGGDRRQLYWNVHIQRFHVWRFGTFPCITRGQWGVSVRIHSKSLACWADLTPLPRPGNKQSGQ